MDYFIHRPSYPVSIFIDHFLVARGFPLFTQERLFPNNRVELCVNLGSTNECRLSFSNIRYSFSSTILSGLRSSYLEIYPGPYFYIAGMRFSLFGFSQLLNIPANEIVNENFSASDVLGKEFNELREKLGEMDDVIQILNGLQQWVLKKAAHNPNINKVWLKIDQVLQCDTTLAKASFPELMGYSRKHTVYLFRQMTGLPPKLIQQIYRLNSVFNHLVHLQNYDWLSLTHASGYYDQSHFIKEFKRFTGFTPIEFIQQSPKDYILRQLR